jgi:ParB-like chromosome segregation protein Spo0J
MEVGVIVSIVHLNPGRVKPLHSTRSPQKFVELANEMEQNGWTGRPLLVIQRADLSYQAWTGSLRIAAAIAAGLKTIPCYVIDEAKLPESIDAQCGQAEDSDLLNAICQTGDVDAIQIMREEGRV